MTVADNFLKASRRFNPVTGEGSQLSSKVSNLSRLTEVSDPNIPTVNVQGAPGIPSIRDAEVFARRDAKARVTQRFRSAGVPQGASISTKGFEKFGQKLGSALQQNRTNPFGIDPADTTASLYAFKEGGFVNKK
jgi:hypothetical protein